MRNGNPETNPPTLGRTKAICPRPNPGVSGFEWSRRRNGNPETNPSACEEPSGRPNHIAPRPSPLRGYLQFVSGFPELTWACIDQSDIRAPQIHRGRGEPIGSRPPLRTVRAVFPHTALHVTLAARHSQTVAPKHHRCRDWLSLCLLAQPLSPRVDYHRHTPDPRSRVRTQAALLS